MRQMPTLEDLEDRLGEADAAAARRRVARQADNRHPATLRDPLHCGGCWCGREQGHRWPGQADGAPHPREVPGQRHGGGEMASGNDEEDHDRRTRAAGTAGHHPGGQLAGSAGQERSVSAAGRAALPL
jgi:hypothetical protein